ncbi:MAG TPA: hypothetical protein VHY22_18730 [Chthoniobacteraceae bacterium]|jgi:hypothetical protein|nr:hypothetical protein [Chthoniobacteraceae bacterium]
MSRPRHFTLIAATLFLAVGARAADTNPALEYGQGPNGGNSAATFSPLPEKVQEDIGDIRPAEQAPWTSYFHGEAAINGQYVSNAPLYHSHDNGDFLIAPMLQGSFTMPLDKHFTLNLDSRIEDFTYASHQTLGFWGFSGDSLIEYRYKPAAPRIYAGMSPYYYWSYATGDRLTSAIGPVAGIDQSFSINRGKTLLYAGYEFGEYYSSPGIDSRQSHTVTVSLTQQLRRDYYAQVYWQLQYSDYWVYGRDETRDVFGVSVIHQFNPHTFASVFVNYVDNASNNTLAKYTTVNSGVSMVWQF